jgi:hypothetical protein
VQLYVMYPKRLSMENVSKAIKKRIQDEIKRHTINCAHGITKENINDHLIEPRLEKYFDAENNELSFEVWTVLEEYPIKQSGYTIFYQEENGKFGLGTHTADGLIHLGLYGTFVKTLNSM